MRELAVGLMSGTSLDGIDAALVRISPTPELELLAFRIVPFTESVRSTICSVLSHGSVREVALLHVQLGELFGAAALAVVRQAGVSPGDLSLVASHGQTVWHEPRRGSLQLGDPSVIAERVGVRVVSDFRSRDVAAGGEGAPLVPIADVYLFGHEKHGRVLLNVGGMANVTWVPLRGQEDGVIAFDTGPGMAVIDAVVRHFDPSASCDVEGRLAEQGEPQLEVLEEFLGNQYFVAPPPKSTGREVFGSSFAEQLIERVITVRSGASAADCVATATALTARSIASAIELWIPQIGTCDLLVSGGGCRNVALMGMLREHLGGVNVVEFAREFFDGDAKEAAAFAYLGWLTVNGRSGNLPAATGARGPRVLGTVTG
ncbi:MAG: anhydro-N-acetylmuramic acid kinase [Gemmatimonadales bacterium]